MVDRTTINLLSVWSQKGAPNDTAPALINHPIGTPARRCSTIAGRTSQRHPNRSAIPSAPGRVRPRVKFSPTLFRKQVNVSCIPVSIRPSCRRQQCVSLRFAQPKIVHNSYAIGVHGGNDRPRAKTINCERPSYHSGQAGVVWQCDSHDCQSQVSRRNVGRPNRLAPAGFGLDFEPTADHAVIINLFYQAGDIWILQQFAEASVEIRHAVVQRPLNLLADRPADKTQREIGRNHPHGYFHNLSASSIRSCAVPKNSGRAVSIVFCTRMHWQRRQPYNSGKELTRADRTVALRKFLISNQNRPSAGATIIRMPQ